jgi:hypothetical protein
MTYHRRHDLPALVLFIGLGLGWHHAAAGSVCSFPTTVAVDMALADTAALAWGCRGYGQVFVAVDTLIESISIWRPPQPTLDARPRRLFITKTDSLGRPDTERLLLDAGPLVRQVGDGVHPVEYRWVFDPPFALPHRGRFFFVIQAEFYHSFAIPAATTNPYQDGAGWETGAVFGCSQPGYPYSDGPHHDLVFRVQLCGSGFTSALPHSWGGLKLIYR